MKGTNWKKNLVKCAKSELKFSKKLASCKQTSFLLSSWWPELHHDSQLLKWKHLFPCLPLLSIKKFRLSTECYKRISSNLNLLYTGKPLPLHFSTCYSLLFLPRLYQHVVQFLSKQNRLRFRTELAHQIRSLELSTEELDCLWLEKQHPNLKDCTLVSFILMWSSI